MLRGNSGRPAALAAYRTGLPTPGDEAAFFEIYAPRLAIGVAGLRRWIDAA